MNLYEFEGKAFLSRIGVATPRGVFAVDTHSARSAAEDIGYPCVVKSQVLTGGRGKAGGIAVVKTSDDLDKTVERILALRIKGESPIGVLIEKEVPGGRELYCSAVFDTSSGVPILLFSPFGGVEVEANEEHLARVPVPIPEISRVDRAWVTGHLRSELDEALFAALGSELLGGVSTLLARLLSASLTHDIELLEINPLIASPAGLVAADAKVVLDDDAIFRQRDLILAERCEPGPLEARAKAAGLNFVNLDGEICLMANGAGLNMSLLDAVAQAGSSPANFLDTGGGASSAKAYEAIRILQQRGLHDPKVRARLVMLSLAITRAREAAQGIVQAISELPDDPVPTFAVVHGTGADEGKRILEDAGIIVAADIKTAVELAVNAQRRA
jgi:succinyl-CoA synthetase beta subunit